MAGGGLRPYPHKTLHRLIDRHGHGEFITHPPQHGDVGKTLLEKQRAQDTPVIGVVPDHLDREYFRISEHRILVPVKRQHAFIKREIEALINPGACLDRFSSAITRHQIDNVSIGDRNKITTGRIERIEKYSRFTGQCPALAGEYLLAAVGEAAQEGKILQQIALAIQLACQPGLVFVQPEHGLVKCVQIPRRMQL